MKKKILVIGGNGGVTGCVHTITRGLKMVGAEVLFIASRSIYKSKGHEGVIEAIVKALESYDFDLVFLWNPKSEFPREIFDSFRKVNVRTLYFSFDDPHYVDTEEYVPGYDCDVVFTGCQDSIEKYQAKGCEAYLVYPPVDVERHFCDYHKDKEADIAFAATNCYTRDRYPKIIAERREMVRTLKDLGSIVLYGYWDKKHAWGSPDGVPEMKKCYRGFVPYEEMPKVYASSKINLNSHVRPDGFMGLSERLFVCLGSGGFMLTDAVNGIERVFKPEVYLEVWRTLDELRDKVEFYLKHDEVRFRIAMRGYSFVHQKFNNIIFAKEVLRILK